MVKSARLELRRVEMLPPFSARLAKCVFELDRLEPDPGQLLQGARNFSRQLLADTPELRPDWDPLPCGRRGFERREKQRRSRGDTAKPENVSPSRVRLHGESFQLGASIKGKGTTAKGQGLTKQRRRIHIGRQASAARKRCL